MSTTLHYRHWHRKQFEELPLRKWDEIIECDALVILPTTDLHDSGYRMMDFVAINDDTPICRCSGGSDVVFLGGIGGTNYLFDRFGLFDGIKNASWQFDCLPGSGLLRLFSNNKLVLGAALSSFEIFYKDK